MDLLRLEVFKPEFVVSVLKMGTLISAIAMHTVRIDHEVELLAGFVHGIKKLKGILMMHIIVSGTVRQLQHDWLD